MLFEGESRLCVMPVQFDVRTFCLDASSTTSFGSRGAAARLKYRSMSRFAGIFACVPCTHCYRCPVVRGVHHGCGTRQGLIHKDKDNASREPPVKQVRRSCSWNTESGTLPILWQRRAPLFESRAYCKRVKCWSTVNCERPVNIEHANSLFSNIRSGWSSSDGLNLKHSRSDSARLCAIVASPKTFSW